MPEMMITYKTSKSIDFMKPCIGAEIIKILLELFALKNVLETLNDKLALPANSITFF